MNSLLPSRKDAKAILLARGTASLYLRKNTHFDAF